MSRTLIFLWVLWMAVPGVRGQVPLTTCAEVRSLDREVAAREIPVQMRGVITFSREDNGVIFDGRESVFVSWDGMRKQGAPRELNGQDYPLPGMEVEVSGVTGPGGYAPVVRGLTIRYLGEGELPEGPLVSLAELRGGHYDCQSVRIAGVVRRVHSAEAAQGESRLEIADGDGRASVFVKFPRGVNTAALVDATVELHGVCFTFFTPRGEVLGVHFRLIRPGDVKVIRSAAEDPFTAPRVSALSLRPFRRQGPDPHRQLLSGMVTSVRLGEFVYAQMAERAVRVNTQRQEPLAPGDLVDAVGFIDNTGQIATMEEAVYRRTGRGLLPVPVRITREEVVSVRTSPASVLRTEDYDGLLVSIEGRLVDIDSRPGVPRRLFLECEGGIVLATLPAETKMAVLGRYRIGSEVLLTGICAVKLAITWPQMTQPAPEDFSLILQGPEDILVLREPSWWTRARLWTALVAAGCGLFITTGLVALLRRKIAERSGELAEEMGARRDGEVEFTATLRERERLSADLHDTLEQILTGVALQIHATQTAPTAERAARNLELATQMLDRSREEVRRSVWNLRSNDLENRLLREALEHIGHGILDGTGIALEVGGGGTEEALTDYTAGNLLLMAKEILTNAIKHGGPERVTILVDYTRDDVTLTVRDDGCGFDPAAAAGPHEGHFGLTGLRERAGRIGGRLEIHSAPGRGTAVTIFVPGSIPR